MAKKNVLTRARKQQALSLMQQGHPAEAKPLLEQVCRADRTDSEAQFMLGIACGMLGDHGKAEQAFRQILKSFPRHPDANNNLGLSL
ncbi:MAG: tetratricopeptide repeat protein, partial [Gammaproteobacteria bacterium]